MATVYIVLAVNKEPEHADTFDLVKEVEAPNALKACRKVAETFEDQYLEQGVTLIAVPARNWNSGRHTLRAETTRRIRSA